MNIMQIIMDSLLGLRIQEVIISINTHYVST